MGFFTLHMKWNYYKFGPFKFTLYRGYIKSAGVILNPVFDGNPKCLNRHHKTTRKHWKITRSENNKKNAHISYPLDHHDFVPCKPQRWLPKIGLYGREEEKWRNIKHKIWRLWAAVPYIKHQVFYGRKPMFNVWWSRPWPAAGWPFPQRRPPRSRLWTSLPSLLPCSEMYPG